MIFTLNFIESLVAYIIRQIFCLIVVMFETIIYRHTVKPRIFWGNVVKCLVKFHNIPLENARLLLITIALVA